VITYVALLSFHTAQISDQNTSTGLDRKLSSIVAILGFFIGILSGERGEGYGGSEWDGFASRPGCSGSSVIFEIEVSADFCTGTVSLARWGIIVLQDVDKD